MNKKAFGVVYALLTLFILSGCSTEKRQKTNHKISTNRKKKIEIITKKRMGS